MTLKKLIGKIHLWLGLASGLVVCIVALTGALWAFESEISDLLYNYRTVQPQARPYLLPSQLKAMAAPYFGKKAIRSIDYAGQDRAVRMGMWEEMNGKDYHKDVYLNPYTGQVLHVNDNSHTFFDVVIELHVNLMLGQTGKYIVDYATLVFLLLLISGVVLWWPKNKAAARQRFWFRWKTTTQWKRKNYDLHNILGFYACGIVIFMALTGLAWAFEWMDKTIYYTATLGKPYQGWKDVTSASDTTQKPVTHLDDIVYRRMIETYQKPFESLSLYLPATKTESYTGYINPDKRTWYRSSSYHFDQRTGQLLGTDSWALMNNGQKVRSMYYDIHIGKILGLPGQILVCAACLVVASLPVTGFLIWWGRRKKEKADTSVSSKTKTLA